MKVRFLLFAIVGLFATSCSKNHVYEKTIDIPSGIWHFDRPVKFEFEITDTTVLYDLVLNFRHQGTYNYSNIWLKISCFYPGLQVKSKRMEYTLATPEGIWIGKGLGDIIDNPFILEEHFRFPQKGKYIYLIRHEMRDDKLENVLSLSLIVTKVKD